MTPNGSMRKPREEKRPSCSRCRSQKLRCDAHLDFSKPCSRCKRLKVECTVPTERLKKALALQTSQQKEASMSLSGSSVGSREHWYPDILDPGRDQMDLSSLGNILSGAHLVAASFDDFSEARVSFQILEGVKVEGRIIEACFKQFNDHYLPLIPILATFPTPETSHEESPLKFWAIVVIGSRRLPEDPTLFDRIAPLVTRLALLSLHTDPASIIPTIEGLILICTWHNSVDRPQFLNVTFILSGAVFHMALQIRLHRLQHVNNIRPVDLPNTEQAKIRANLWAQALISYQSTMTLSGQLLDIQHTEGFWDNRSITNLIPASTCLRANSLATVVKVLSGMSELGIEREETVQKKAVKSIIRASEAQIHNIRHQFEQTLGPLDELYLAISLLHIRLFNLFCDCDIKSIVDLVQLFATSVSVMDEIRKLDRSCGIAKYCPDFIFAAICISTVTVIKLLKGPVLQYVDAEMGTETIFAAIDLCKRISVRNNDVPAKAVGVYSRLWSSDSMYRNPDGTPRWPLQIRDRLAVSVLFDAFWWQQEVSRNPAYALGTFPAENPYDIDMDLFLNNNWWLDMNWGSLDIQ